MLDFQKGAKRVGFMKLKSRNLISQLQQRVGLLSLGSGQTLRILIKGKNDVFKSPDFDSGDSQSREKFLQSGLIQEERLRWGGEEENSLWSCPFP